MTADKHTPSIFRAPTQTPTYRSWASMWYRCMCPDSTSYKNYGGRGILVHLRWLNYQLFVADMGERPVGTSLDRIDPTKGYFPSNCRWATRKVQGRNKRNLHYLTIDGERKCLADWEEHHGLPNGILRQRIKLNWPIERLFSKPRNTGRRASVSKIFSDAMPVIAEQRTNEQPLSEISSSRLYIRVPPN